MRLTIIRDDGIVGIDGVFREVDLTGLPEGVRAVQWSGEIGHVEHDNMTNAMLGNIAPFQIFIDRWTAAAPIAVPPSPAERIAAAHARINAAYTQAIDAITAGYPDTEIASWPKQEAEARAWLTDNNAPTPWIDSAAMARSLPKPEFVAKVIEQADLLAPMHGALSGIRQYRRDQIDALGDMPTQEQLDSIQW